VVLNSTNGIEMPMQLISVKESKAGSFVQVVPEYRRLKNRYQLLWDQKDCVEYLKTSAVLSVYVDQSISTNTFYSPKHFADGKVPGTLIAKNLMLAHRWGLRTLYYSLLDKVGGKAQLNDVVKAVEIIEDDEGSCDSCVL
jgi:ribonucleoside-diphosphate reductase alpha chain